MNLRTARKVVRRLRRDPSAGYTMDQRYRAANRWELWVRRYIKIIVRTSVALGTWGTFPSEAPSTQQEECADGER